MSAAVVIALTSVVAAVCWVGMMLSTMPPDVRP